MPPSLEPLEVQRPPLAEVEVLPPRMSCEKSVRMDSEELNAFFFDENWSKNHHWLLVPSSQSLESI